jgi:hypothetical protein
MYLICTYADVKGEQKALEGNPGRRRKGRPRKRWLDGVRAT